MDDFKYYKTSIKKYAEETVLHCMARTQPQGKIQLEETDREVMDYSCNQELFKKLWMDNFIRNNLRSYIVVSTAYTESTQKLMRAYQGSFNSVPE